MISFEFSVDAFQVDMARSQTGGFAKKMRMNRTLLRLAEEMMKESVRAEVSACGEWRLRVSYERSSEEHGKVYERGLAGVHVPYVGGGRAGGHVQRKVSPVPFRTDPDPKPPFQATLA